MNRNMQTDKWRAEFEEPSEKYRMKTILHRWPEEPEILLDAVQAFGYGGVATNPSFENGYTANPDNLKRFGELTRKILDRGLSYWIYDENGYPSGYAGGQTLKEHPELEAKGFYMVRRIAYQPRKVVYHLDDESDRIVWAAKYPLDCSVMNASIVAYEKMEPAAFTDTYCACKLGAEEVLFIFCVKSAYEGTHCVHNVCSRSRYINIMNRDAVKRFLEINYEPIVREAPFVYQQAEAVFTDEPSMMVGYIHGDETWPYALAPWADGLFKSFEEEYGFSLYPYLPMIFEGRSNAYSIRVSFYRLVGKLIAQSYVKQISDWCRAHGSIFSGHYLAEESLQAHVIYYGSYLEVLKAADYPGVDILASYPEIFEYNTPKYAQMAARKNGSGGVMVELCPFIRMSHFKKNPVLYARGILNLMFLGGCRKVNSYFAPDFAEYEPQQLAGYKGYMSQKQGRELNAYVGRLISLLEGIQNITGTFMYYAIEEAQAKTRPSHCAVEASDSAVDRSLRSITAKIYENGHDYLFCDREDLAEAKESLEKGAPTISGMKVEHVILPAMDVIYEESWKALEALQEAGVKVWFADQLPRFFAEHMTAFEYYDFREEAALHEKLQKAGRFTAVSEEEILKGLNECRQEFRVQTEDGNSGILLKAMFCRENNYFYFVVNNSEKDMQTRWEWDGIDAVQVWDPEDGKVHLYDVMSSVMLKAYQGVFFFKNAGKRFDV